jgi:hypothetical protein
MEVVYQRLIHFGAISMFGEPCSGTDLKNIHSVIVHCASRKIVNADFSSRSCLQSLHTFTRTKVKDQNKTLWYFLDGSVNTVYPYMVLPRQPMGCKFINAHNKAISDVFNFNTNIQIGDASQVFYSTLYTSKSTQDEDSKKQIRIGCAVIKWIKQVLNDKHEGEPSFGEGFSRVLSGLNAATTRNVISATMAHLIPCTDGSRFVYSHTFSDLLVGQMEATLEGQDINVTIRSYKLQDKIITWPDSLAYNYIHRTIDYELDQICFY